MRYTRTQPKTACNQQQARVTREMSIGHEQSDRFAKDMKLLENECKGAGLGEQFSRVLDVLIQKRNSETPQEYPVKAPPPVKPQVEQYPTKHTIQPTSDAHIVSADTSRPAHRSTDGSNNAVQLFRPDDYTSRSNESPSAFNSSK